MVHLTNGKYFAAPLLLNARVILFILIPIFAAILIFKIFKKQFNPFRIITIGVLFVYLYFLIKLTLMPISLFGWHHEVYSYGLGKQQVFTFNITALQYYLPTQILGNLILLAPFSFIVAILYQPMSKLRYNWVTCLAVSLGIETMQATMNFFYLGNRLFDINDLLLNTFGALLGFLAFKIFNLLFSKEIAFTRGNQKLKL